MRYEITPDFPSSTLSPSIECQTLTILHRARRSYQTRPDWAGPAIYCFQRTLAPAPSGLVGDLLLRVDSTWPGSFWSPFIRSYQSGNSGQRTKRGRPCLLDEDRMFGIVAGTLSPKLSRMRGPGGDPFFVRCDDRCQSFDSLWSER